MISRAATIAILLLIFGLIGGYSVGSATLRGQLTALSIAHSNTVEENLQLKETIDSLRENIIDLNQQVTALEQAHGFGTPVIITHGTVGWQFQGWSNQTYVIIDSVTWGSQTSTIDSIDIRNTGNIDETLVSISITRNQPGNVTYSTQLTDSVSALSHKSIDLYQAEWNPSGFNWFGYGSYVVRVTCSTGFYYEAVFSAPGY